VARGGLRSSVEEELGAVHSLAPGVLVVAQRRWRRRLDLQRPDPTAVLVDESQRLGIGRVARVAKDVELAEVMGPVMAATETRQIVGIGRPAPTPMAQVVDLEASCGPAPGEPAATIATDDH
jgi:hypothetical protein